MALVTPLLLVIMMGSLEVGNFFYNEHILTKAVRDGARYAARQGFSNYDCSGAPGGTVEADTRTLVKTMLLSGGSDRLANWNASSITVSEACVTAATDLSGTSHAMTGIYRELSTTVPVVTVSAQVPYTPVIGAFGFTGMGVNLNASQQAAVAGI
jgi:Flp pilus assembly protein TadG